MSLFFFAYEKTVDNMNIEELRAYCLSKPHATEDFPFDDTTLAFRVGDKIFALSNIEEKPVSVSLKCPPEKAVELRERYSAVTPGYHLNKTNWNTVLLDGTIDDDDVRRLIDLSYKLVYKSLTRKTQIILEQGEGE
jgi:predicted DNA-binding protein (MmcQ/YjbR family)